MAYVASEISIFFIKFRLDYHYHSFRTLGMLWNFSLILQSKGERICILAQAAGKKDPKYIYIHVYNSLLEGSFHGR